MARTRKKELVFHISDTAKQTQFLETVQKKIKKMVDLHIIQKLDTTRLRISGTHENVRYAIQLIRRIYESLEAP